MGNTRYLACGVASLAILYVVFSLPTPQPPLTVSIDSKAGENLSIRLVEATKPKKTETVPTQNLKAINEETKDKVAVLEEAAAVEPVKKEDKPSVAKVSPKEAKELKKPLLAKAPAPNKKSVLQKEPVKEKEPVQKLDSAPKRVKQPEQASPNSIQMSASAPVLLDKPRFKAKPTPIKYPRIARKRGIEGEILIEVWLNKQGQQLKQVLLRSSGHSVLDKAALKTIGKWKFSGAKQNGLAVAHRVHIPVRFKLD